MLSNNYLSRRNTCNYSNIVYRSVDSLGCTVFNLHHKPMFDEGFLFCQVSDIMDTINILIGDFLNRLEVK